MVTDQVVRVKEDVDDIWDGCDVEFVWDGHPNAFFSGLGQEPSSEVFKLLVSSPAVNIQYSYKIELGDLGLPKDTMDIIQERARNIFIEI